MNNEQLTTDNEQRFILTQLNQLTLVFPSTLVAEISIVERSQILALPFYSQAILGAIYHQSQIVLLISLHQILEIPAGLMSERLTIVRLSDAAGDLAGLGLVIEATLGIRSPEQLPPDLFSAKRLANSTNSEPNMRLFQPEILGSHLWHPQRWQPVGISNQSLI